MNVFFGIVKWEDLQTATGFNALLTDLPTSSSFVGHNHKALLNTPFNIYCIWYKIYELPSKLPIYPWVFM